MVPIDPVRRAAMLIRGRDGWSTWRARVNNGADYEAAAIRLVGRLFPMVAAVEVAPVVGHLWATPPLPGTGARTEARLFLAITPGMAERSSASGGEQTRSRWFSHEELTQRQGAMHPPELPSVIDGYWDGWLPDGPLTLEWG